MSLRTDNLIIPQGATWEARWPIENEDGTPADLTGYNVRAHVRTEKYSATTLHEWSSTTDTNASIIGSEVSLTVSPEDSTAWTWRVGYYDIEIFHSDGRVMRVTQGTITVDLEVTR